MVLDDEAKEFELRGQSAALQGVQQGCETALGQEEFAQPRLPVAGHGICETHVQFQEEHGGDEEVLVAPEPLVVHQPDSTCVVADVEGEP